MKLDICIITICLAVIALIGEVAALRHDERSAVDNSIEEVNEYSGSEIDGENGDEDVNFFDSLYNEIQITESSCYELSTIELQNKVHACFTLIEHNKKRIIDIMIGGNKGSTDQEIKALNDEKLAYLNDNVKINIHCNAFINLLLYKRIKMFSNERINIDIKNKDVVESEINNLVNNLVIDEHNAPFIRSLVLKTKCDSFQESFPCKTITNKLMNFMAITPYEVIQEFENVTIHDSNT